MYDLTLGDCRAVMAGFAPDSIDAIVCDPPYDLTKVSRNGSPRQNNPDTPFGRTKLGGDRGFMGKSWDGTGIAFDPATWAEALRVLKPGGHLLSFGGTRTYHRLTCAIEDAGFEIRDSIMWLYGCHDDATEALTARGWVNGLDLRPDDEVAQWHPNGTLSLVRPSALHRYPYDGDLVRFQHSDLDQAVTPNHRVVRQVHERNQVEGVRSGVWSEWRVDEAASINRYQPMRVPSGGVHDGPGIGGIDYAAFLGWVWTEGGFDLTGTGVRVYQSSVNQPFVDEIAALCDRLGHHKRYDYQRSWKGRAYTATTWFLSGDLAKRVRADLPGKTPTWELLWRMSEAEKRAMWDAAMKGDGSKGHRSFWQKDRGALEWAQALVATLGMRAKVADDPRGVLHWSDRTTIELQARHLAHESTVSYVGEVWCATVPSGAFVVRRNGRVSVSGNSGFPKSLDVAKALTKSGQYASAQEWKGFGTALKPSYEPVVVARKPLAEKTVAANVLVYGTGAMHIDACRIRWGAEGDNSQARRDHGYSDAAKRALGSVVAAESASGFSGEVEGSDSTGGRWPANVVLSHSDGCVQLGEKTVTSTGHTPATRGPGGLSTSGHGGQHGLVEHRSGTETVVAFDCVAGCPVAELDAQSGVSLSTGGRTANISKTSTIYGSGKGLGQDLEPDAVRGDPGFGDKGGASRFFYQCAPDCPVAALDEQSGQLRSGSAGADGHHRNKPDGDEGIYGGGRGLWTEAGPAGELYGDTGGASRFFGDVTDEVPFRYVAKASRSERVRGIRYCECEEKNAPSATSPERATTESPMTAGSEWNMTSSGNRPTDQSLLDMTSTIATTSSSTTTSTTSNCSTSSPTNDSTADANSGTESGGNPAPSVLPSSPSTSITGTSVKRVGRSTDVVDPATSGSSSKPSKPGAGPVCASCGGLVSRIGHATVKPIALMRWLCRLVTRPGGVVLDPFTGSGTTGVACIQEGFNFLGIESEADYIAIAEARLAHAESHLAEQHPLF